MRCESRFMGEVLPDASTARSVRGVTDSFDRSRMVLEAVRPGGGGRGFAVWAVLDWNEPSIAYYERQGTRPVAGWTRYRWTRAGSAGGVS
jgi:hypothetical protein